MPSLKKFFSRFTNGRTKQQREFQKAGFTTTPKYQRYLSGKETSADALMSAARSYVMNRSHAENAWLYCKPYDRSPGNAGFFIEMYQVMNLLKAMEIPCHGRILEVGSGSGWITEILVALGYEVHGIEPCSDMIEIARQRVTKAIDHWQVKNPPPFDFFCQTLEECSLSSEHYDAIFLHATLHHIIDERAGFLQCQRLLKPGGVIGISEYAWEPGNRALESALDEEMQRFGTLENPFTREYLDYLLAESGFTEIQRYHSINGLVPQHLGAKNIESIADAPARATNNVTARKKGDAKLTTRTDKDYTYASIQVLTVELTEENTWLQVDLELKNTGKSVWLHQGARHGWVSIAVRTEPLGARDYCELERSSLPREVYPGEALRIRLELAVPKDFLQRDWHVDLVNEEMFWFSERGSKAVPLKVHGSE